MEMRYFWLLDQQVQKMFKFQYQPGAENLGDYPSKAHLGTGHQHVRPYYLHEKNSPRYLKRAAKPSARQGCAELLADPYHKKVPLPRIPNNPVHPVDAIHMAQVAIGAVNISAAPINCWNISQLIRTTAPLACNYLSYWGKMMR